MKPFLEKLDSVAGRWLESLDEQLQAPIVHAMTGEVFTHGTVSKDQGAEQHVMPRATEPLITPACLPCDSGTSAGDGMRRPVLQKATT
jgi:hypothetical protein